MPTLDLRVADVMDNFCILPGLRTDRIYEDDPIYWVGNLDPGNEANFRFLGVTIPKGSTINSATLSGYGRTSWTQDTDTWATLGAEQADNPARIVNDADETIPFNEFQTRSANVGTTVTWQSGSISANDPVPSPDLATLVQEVVDRNGWASGNAIQFFSVSNVTDGNDYQLWSFWNGTAAYYPRLQIDYTEPAADSVTSVTVTPSTATLAPTETQQLTADVVVTGSASQAVTWSTSDAAVATVSTSGLVTAVANGTATITATSDFDGTKSDTSTITVSTATSGTVDVRVAAIHDSVSIVPSVNTTKVYNTDPVYWVGNVDPPLESLFRFLNIDIPQGATILSATLTGYSHTNWGTVADAYVTVGMEQVDNAAQIDTTTQQDAYDSFQTKSANIGSTLQWSSVAAAAADTAQPVDVASLLQTIVNRAGWVSGNAVQFFAVSNVSAASDFALRSYYNGTATTYPRLEVSWEEGTGDTTAPTVTVDAIHGAGAFTSIVDSAGYTEGTDTLTVTGTAADTGGSGLASVEVSVNGGAWVAATGTATWTIDLDASAFPTGVFNISARAKDGQGNTSSTVNRTVWHSPDNQWGFSGVGLHAEPLEAQGWQ